MEDRISAKTFVAWMTTQPNRNGTLYLERVVWQYVRCLRAVPPKLDLPLSNAERDVFACRTTAELERLTKAFVTAPNFKKVDYANSHCSFSAGLLCYKRYLEHLTHESDAALQKQGGSMDSVDTTDVVSIVKTKPVAESKAIDFSDLSIYVDTRPDKCIIDGETVTALNWSAMYISVIERLLVTRNRPIASVKIKTKSGRVIPLLLDAPLAGMICTRLSNGKYLKTNYSAPQTIRLIGILCDACGVKKERIGLTYCANNQEANEMPFAEQHPQHNKGAITSNIDDDTATAIDLILTERYANGFRLGSFIETERLRKFVDELLSTPLKLTDAELECHVKSCGTIFGGKVYVVSAETKRKIKILADDYFAGGANTVFYESFFSRHESWLIESSIVSEETLTAILRKLYPKKQFTDTYFGDTRDNIPNVVKREILRIWGNNVLMTFETIGENLMYIPLYRIKQFLAVNADFIWNATGEYTHISRISITDDEKNKFRAFAQDEISKHSYVSIADFPFDEFAERNYELSQTAIHNAVFRICLSGTYEQHGKIITRKGDNLTAKDILEEYCRSLDSCTLDELLDYERELTGECHRWIPMQAGYDIMVRTDKGSFLAEKFMHFDRNGIDGAIEHFIAGGEYVPLRHITTFAAFPHCGQPWTLFLLESYCRRFSERFRFDALSVNSTNAGAIVRRNSKLNYHEIMIDAVAKSGINLMQDTVLDFLVTEGYTSQRRYAKITELIAQATTKRSEKMNNRAVE